LKCRRNEDLQLDSCPIPQRVSGGFCDMELLNVRLGTTSGHETRWCQEPRLDIVRPVSSVVHSLVILRASSSYVISTLSISGRTRIVMAVLPRNHNTIYCRREPLHIYYPGIRFLILSSPNLGLSQSVLYRALSSACIYPQVYIERSRQTRINIPSCLQLYTVQVSTRYLP
jgi:hypothetical protein